MLLYTMEETGTLLGLLGFLGGLLQTAEVVFTGLCWIVPVVFFLPARGFQKLRVEQDLLVVSMNLLMALAGTAFLLGEGLYYFFSWYSQTLYVSDAISGIAGPYWFYTLIPYGLYMLLPQIMWIRACRKSLHLSMLIWFAWLLWETVTLYYLLLYADYMPGSMDWARRLWSAAAGCAMTIVMLTLIYLLKSRRIAGREAPGRGS